MTIPPPQPTSLLSYLQTTEQRLLNSSCTLQHKKYFYCILFVFVMRQNGTITTFCCSTLCCTMKINYACKSHAVKYEKSKKQIVINLNCCKYNTMYSSVFILLLFTSRVWCLLGQCGWFWSYLCCTLGANVCVCVFGFRLHPMLSAVWAMCTQPSVTTPTRWRAISSVCCWRDKRSASSPRLASWATWAPCTPRLETSPTPFSATSSTWTSQRYRSTLYDL